MSGIEFRYEPGPGEPLAARLGHYPPEKDVVLDTLRAVARPAISGLVRLTVHVDVVGVVPDVPRLALLPNHQSHLDTLAIFAAMPDRFRRRITLLAARDYFFERWPTALAVSLVGRCALARSDEPAVASSDAGLACWRARGTAGSWSTRPAAAGRPSRTLASP